MITREIAVAVLLALTVLSCWVGALGMWRMKEPTEALHYMAIPADIGMALLTAAVFVETGFSQASVKCLVIFVVMVASNAIGAHAAARAFRARKLGQWEPQPEDDIEFSAGKPKA
jgi:monovalent cation/proton antiporter MnhG/PhaG subunit